jgi:hypothetical protein
MFDISLGWMLHISPWDFFNLLYLLVGFFAEGWVIAKPVDEYVCVYVAFSVHLFS